MTVHPAKGLELYVADATSPHDKHLPQHVSVRRFTLRAQDEATRSYAEHPWQVQSGITRQSGVIEADIAYGA